jgi:GNAT superfamily N-acetyltransferase
MYFEYLREREPEIKILQRDHGFALYSKMTVKGEPAIYISDIYVQPDYRKTRLASEMSEDIQCKAKEEGVKYLVGSVAPSAEGSHESLLVLLAHGMKILESDHNLVWFFKEI